MSFAQLIIEHGQDVADEAASELLESDTVIEGILHDMDLRDSVQIQSHFAGNREALEHAEWDQRNDGEGFDGMG